MTESQVFVSSCSRREMVRRRHRSWLGVTSARLSLPTLTGIAFVLVCAGAFLAGRGAL